jgi:hypothetical protein
LFIEVDASHVPKEKDSAFRGLDINNIIFFEENDGVLSVRIAVGLHGFDVAPAFGNVYFYADINLDERGNISLADPRLEKEAAETFFSR